MEIRDQHAAKSDVMTKAEGPSPGILKEFLLYLRESRKWWLLPIVVILLLASALVFLSGSAAGPFLYPLF